jgi:hypothetical protein
MLDVVHFRSVSMCMCANMLQSWLATCLFMLQELFLSVLQLARAQSDACRLVRMRILG